MANTEEQELSDQLRQLCTKLVIYHKALSNPHLCREDYQIFLGNILWLEAQISELQAQLEIHQLIGRLYNASVSVLFPALG